MRACRGLELFPWPPPLPSTFPPTPLHTHCDHNSESVARPGREQALFTFRANVVHTRTIQPASSQRACVRPDASQVLACSSRLELGLRLRLCFVPAVLPAVSSNSCLPRAEWLAGPLLPPFPAPRTIPLPWPPHGVDLRRISIFSMSPPSPKLGRKEDCTIRERDEFGWRIL